MKKFGVLFLIAACFFMGALGATPYRVKELVVNYQSSDTDGNAYIDADGNLRLEGVIIAGSGSGTQITNSDGTLDSDALDGGGGGGSGDVTGDSVSVDGALVAFDGTSGKLIQYSANAPILDVADGDVAFAGFVRTNDVEITANGTLWLQEDSTISFFTAGELRWQVDQDNGDAGTLSDLFIDVYDTDGAFDHHAVSIFGDPASGVQIGVTGDVRDLIVTKRLKTGSGGIFITATDGYIDNAGIPNDEIGVGKLDTSGTPDGTKVLRDDGAWVNLAADDLSDVAISSPASGHVLVYNSGFVNVAMAGDITINSGGTTTIQANSVALATDTTGAYVADLTAGTAISVSGGGAENANITIAVNDAELTSIAGLTSAADRLAYYTGSGTAALTVYTAFGRSLDDDADAAAGRTTLGVVIGTHVQAYDADLGVIAALADPNADRILFWDDSAGAYAYLTAGSSLAITTTTIETSLGTAITSTEVTDGELVNVDISNSAAIVESKLVIARTIWLAAGSAWNDTSEAPGLDANKNVTVGFGNGEIAYWNICLPSSYDGTTASYKVWYYKPDTNAVTFTFEAVVLSDTDAMSLTTATGTMVGTTLTPNGSSQHTVDDMTESGDNFFGANTNANKWVRIKLTVTNATGGDVEFLGAKVEY